MSTKSIIFSNTFYQLIGRFGTVFFTFLLSIVLTRFGSENLWGQYSVVLNYLALFYMMADFGMNIIVVKDFAQNDEVLREQFAKVFGFKLILGLALTIFSVLLTYFLPYTVEIKSAILSGALLILLFSLQNSLLIIFQTKLEYWKSAVTNLCTGLLTFGSIYLYITLSNAASLNMVVILTILSYLIGLAVSVVLVKSQVNLSIRSLFDWVYSRSLFNRSFFIGLTVILNSFMFSGDKFLLSLYQDNFSVGIYTLAYKLFELFLVLPTFIMNANYPLLLKLRAEGYEVVFRKIIKIAIFMMPIWFVSALILLIAGKVGIPLIWGSTMDAAIKPFSILILTSIPFFITAPLTWIYYIEGWNKQLLMIYLTGFIVNLLLNLYYIPLNGYIGAAYITGVTELLVLIMLLIGFRFNQSSRS
jgi:O-antigen/teichoic acid export membrane protein